MPILPKGSLFFDIETTGFDPERGSILSLSFGTHPNDISSTFAAPQEGQRIYKWVSQNVWKPIQRQTKKFISEEQLISRFIDRLREAPEGSVVAGWNIGFDVSPKGQAVGRGFDIPFLMSRAGKYNLQEKMGAAFGRLQVRDIGQEFALRVTGEALANPALVERNLFESYMGYQKAAGGAPLPEDIPTVARNMAISNKQVVGWKQELLHTAVFPEIPLRAHQSAEDVRAGLRLGSHQGPVFSGPQGLSKWAREAKVQSLVNRAVAPRSESAAAGHFESLLEQARKPVSGALGEMEPLERQFLSTLEKTIEERGGRPEEVYSGRGLVTEEYSVFKNRISLQKNKFKFVPAMDDLAAFAKTNRRALGIGAVALGALVASNLFSGKDDEYNVLEGLPHGGFAERMRKGMTDFGSGWIRNMMSKAFNLGKKTPGKSNLYISAEEMTRMSSGDFFAALRNRQTQEATALGTFSSAKWSVTRAEIAAMSRKDFADFIIKKGAGSGAGFQRFFRSEFPEDIARLPKSATEKLLERAKSNQPKFIRSGEVAPGGTVGARKPSEMPTSKEKFIKKHAQSVISSSMNGLRPGRRHVHKTGKIVQ